MERTGLAKRTVVGHLKEFRNANQCHIGDWAPTENGGRFLVIYTPGPGVDVPCPSMALTNKARSERYKSKAILSGAWERRKEKDAIGHRAAWARKKKWAASLFTAKPREYF